MSVCLILPAPIWAQEELSHDTAQSKPSREKIEVVALKNNLAYDAILTPNLEIEFRLAPKWSMELGAAFNPFPLDDTKFPKWRHVSAWIAPRYWFCNVFNRGFLSFNVAYAHYNVAGNAWPVSWMYKQVKESRYQGDAVMAGVSYGWHFAISPHFSVELEGGVDAVMGVDASRPYVGEGHRAAHQAVQIGGEARGGVVDSRFVHRHAFHQHQHHVHAFRQSQRGFR